MESERITSITISVEELRRSLECPVCLITPKVGPLYQCDNGHILCPDCYKKVVECPQCKKGIFHFTKPIRSLFAEQQLERLPLQCKYTTNGCEFERLPSKKKDIHNHEKHCQHRNVECPDCVGKVASSKLSIHFKESHAKIIEKKTNSCENDALSFAKSFFHDRLNTGLSTYRFTCYEEKQFYPMIRRTSNKSTYIWVYVNGTTKEEENFTYTFTLYNVNKSKSKSCKGNVISIDTPWKTICSEESGVAGLVLSDATLKQLAGTTFTDVNEKVQLPYSLIIESEKNTPPGVLGPRNSTPNPVKPDRKRQQPNENPNGISSKMLRRTANPTALETSMLATLIQLKATACAKRKKENEFSLNPEKIPPNEK